MTALTEQEEYYADKRQELDTYLEGAMVGSPKAMALADMVNLWQAQCARKKTEEYHIARAKGSSREKDGTPYIEEIVRDYVRIELVKARINGRISEISGYLEAYGKISRIRQNIAETCPGNYLLKSNPNISFLEASQEHAHEALVEKLRHIVGTNRFIL